MKKTIALFTFCALFCTVRTHAQFDLGQVRYWIGSGPDSSVLVIDFLDGTFDPSHAWGYLHDGSATALDMIIAIDAADTNLEVEVASGFINTITYNSHAGIGGAPNYWSSWTGTGIADMLMNSGASEPLSNGEWFGCSYTDFDPAIAPGEPQAAFDPLSFSFAEVTYWIGTGQDSAVLVIDFQDGAGIGCYAWGYRFDGTTTGEELLNAIDAADPDLDVEIMGGFLNTISYHSHAGIGGSPDYWSTWSAPNVGGWESNLGIGTAVNNGTLFGCSYTDFAPALRPFAPVAAAPATSIADLLNERILVYPQPARGVVHVDTGTSRTAINFFDMAGRRIHSVGVGSGSRTIDVDTWPAGLYVLETGNVKRTIAVH